MTHAVVAVDVRRRDPFIHDADTRSHVHTARFDAQGVRRQANDAVTVGALHVGIQHQRRNNLRVVLRQANAFESRGNKRLQHSGREATEFGHWEPALMRFTHCGRAMKRRSGGCGRV